LVASDTLADDLGMLVDPNVWGGGEARFEQLGNHKYLLAINPIKCEIIYYLAWLRKD